MASGLVRELKQQVHEFSSCEQPETPCVSQRCIYIIA
jgi:hypothetical protein